MSDSRGDKNVNVLDASEERIIRMRNGLPLPDSMPLGRKGEGFPDVLAQLRAMEEEAFAATGRIDDLRREIGVEVGEGDDASTKGKIVASLKGKADVSDEATEDADAQVTTTAKTRGSSNTGR